MNLLPIGGNSTSLYLYPLNKPTPQQWYGDCPVGLNTICETVKKLVGSVGITDGKFTNHSLRAMAATRMFNAGIPEKVVKEITGHCSDAVREYECTNLSMKHKAVATISNPENKTQDEVESKNRQHFDRTDLTFSEIDLLCCFAIQSLPLFVLQVVRCIVLSFF